MGVVAQDVVILGGGGTFANSMVGTNKPVTATMTLAGADAANYTLSQPTGLTADITGGILKANDDNFTIGANAGAFKSITLSLPSLLYNDGQGLGAPKFSLVSTANDYRAEMLGNSVAVVRTNGLVPGEVFQYKLSEDLDGNGKIEAGEESIGVVSFTLGTDNAGKVRVADSRTENGNFILIFSAMPGTKWRVQKTATLNPPFWVDIGSTQTADGNGYFQVNDPLGPSPAGFYQAYRVP